MSSICCIPFFASFLHPSHTTVASNPPCTDLSRFYIMEIIWVVKYRFFSCMYTCQMLLFHSKLGTNTTFFAVDHLELMILYREWVWGYTETRLLFYPWQHQRVVSSFSMKALRTHKSKWSNVACDPIVELPALTLSTFWTNAGDRKTMVGNIAQEKR